MIIIYSLIIILTFSTFSYLILDNYKTKGIKAEEDRLFLTANIVADTYKRNVENIVYTRTMVKTYAHQVKSRILVVNSEKEVLVDSYNSYIGKSLNNKEIRSSLNGKFESGLYTIDNMEVLQLAVPITINTGMETEIAGSVLISASMNHLSEDLTNLKNDILRISIFALLGAIILTAVSASGITRSLRALTKGVENISSGHLGYKIESFEEGDVGKLIETFNEMSQKLNDILS